MRPKDWRLRNRSQVWKFRSRFRVQTLKGLLPIGAGGKRIRDDRGYWNQFEHCLSTRAEVRFTHSLCPEGVKKYYGDDDAKV